MKVSPIQMGAAPLVASALGRALGITVEFGRTQTAMTDGKTIVLPVMPIDLPQSVATILWGFIHHEAGHCRHTDFETLKEPELAGDRMVSNVFFALEDIRMERAHMTLYPGAARILSQLVSELVRIGFFKPIAKDDNVVGAFHDFILKHLRATVLGQSALAEQADRARSILESKLGAGFATRLSGELQAILDAAETGDALDLALRVRQLLKEELEAREPPPSSGSEANKPGSSNDDAGDSAPGTSPDVDVSSSNAPKPSSGDEGANSDESDLSAVNADGTDDDAALNALKAIAAGADLDASQGDLGEALAKVLDDGIAASPGNPVSLPKDERRSDGCRDADAVAAARAISTRLAVQLRRRLESVNEVPNPPRTRGKRISRRHISRVAFDDYRIFQHRAIETEVNTAVVTLLDVSSSMNGGGRVNIATQAGLATSLALESIPHLAHAVGAFPGMRGPDFVEVIEDFHESPQQVSSRYSTRGRGNTPLAKALLWAADRLLQRSEERMVVYVATDGQPDDPASAKQIIAHLNRMRIEVHGLGINTDDRHGLFQSFAEVTDVAALPEAFISLSDRVLKRSA